MPIPSEQSQPGLLVAELELTNPEPLTEDFVNIVRSAPPGTTLDANTKYWITVNEGHYRSHTGWAT